MEIKNKNFIKNLSKEELVNYFESIGEKKFRAIQVFGWLYNKHAKSFDEMLNISKELRNTLEKSFRINTLEKIETQNSISTGTKKLLFKTFDNRFIESVIIPEGERNTLCISTQVGCPLDCKFCATGVMGYKRNLTIGEIVDQYISAINEGNKITNIVYMGMGEPLLNFANTLGSLKIFTDEKTTGLSRNRITISTAGIAPKIIELSESNVRVKLALSLHSGFDEIRDKIMPINKKYNLKQVLGAIEYYAKESGTRITFEYTMLKGINDREEDIMALTKITRRIPSKINLIPFNSIKHMNPEGISAQLEPTPFNEIEKFAAKLRENNITVMVRETQGDDIAAACGQLAVKVS